MKRGTKQEKLEKQRKVFFLMGLSVALILVLAAFEWKTYDYSLPDIYRTNIGWEDEDLPEVTQHKKPELPIPKVEPVAAIKEVDNEQEVAELELFNPEMNQEEAIPEFIYTPPEEPEEGQGVDFVMIPEVMPEFPGGDIALIKYLGSKIYYTQMAKEANIQGTVFVDFIVEKDGSISSVKIRRGIGGGLDEIALEAVKGMPIWSPGKQRGRAVRVPMVVPIKFRLQ